MKSRISIEVDFDNSNQPIIQILQKNSDDVRDKLVRSFTEQFGGSSWCKIEWKDGIVMADQKDNEPFSMIHLSPVYPKEFKEHAKLMLDQMIVYENWLEQQGYDMFHYNNTGELKYKINSN